MLLDLGGCVNPFVLKLYQRSGLVEVTLLLQVGPPDFCKFFLDPYISTHEIAREALVVLQNSLAFVVEE